MVSLVFERAKVQDRLLKMVREDKRLFGQVLKNQNRLEGQGNVLDRAKNASIADQSAQIEALVQANATRKGPLSDALNEAAIRVRDGSKPKAEAEQILQRLRDGDIDLSSKSLESPDGVAGQAGRSPDAPGTRGSDGGVESGRGVPKSEPTRLDYGQGKKDFDQFLVDGTERTDAQAIAAHNAGRGGRMGADVTQKPMDEGLFDAASRDQQSLFGGAPMTTKADLQAFADSKTNGPSALAQEAREQFDLEALVKGADDALGPDEALEAAMEGVDDLGPLLDTLPEKQRTELLGTLHDADAEVKLAERQRKAIEKFGKCMGR
jgi:hypothetical protein